MANRTTLDQAQWLAAVRLRTAGVIRALGPVKDEMCGRYGPKVDRNCGVEEPAVDLWETGELVPTPEQVQALAQLTGYPVVFFYRPIAPAGQVWVCSRRRGGGCELVDRDPPRPDGGTNATVIPLHNIQPTLF